MAVQKYIRILKDEGLWERYVYNYFHFPSEHNSGDIFKDMECALNHKTNGLVSAYKGWRWFRSTEGVEFWTEKRNLMDIKYHLF